MNGGQIVRSDDTPETWAFHPNRDSVDNRLDFR